MVKAFVFAGNLDQYKWFVKENMLNKKEYPRLTDANKMLGHAGVDVIRIGRWYDHPDSVIKLADTIQRANKRAK